MLALTPVAALMFRFNNPDALLVLLLTRAPPTRWCARSSRRGRCAGSSPAGVFVGLAFLTKMLQAFLVLPGFACVYLLAAPVDLRRRLGRPAGRRRGDGRGRRLVGRRSSSCGRRRRGPTSAARRTTSFLELTFGYNGFGRLTGDETGSVVPGGGGGGGGSMWGETGIDRLFNASIGGQIAWLLPAALILLVAPARAHRRAGAHRPTRAAVARSGAAGCVDHRRVIFSFRAGIIHAYYTVALAPAIGALVGIGAVELWPRRHQHLGAGGRWLR